MSRAHLFATLRQVMVPVIHDCESLVALQVARALGAETTLVGFVPMAGEETLSAGAAQAKQMRRRLRSLAEEGIRARARVYVSRAPWQDMREAISRLAPDLLILEWPHHLQALGIDAADVLSDPPCDVALVRGPIPERLSKALIPIRGGPHAELALRIGLSLRPHVVNVLHLVSKEGSRREPAFRAIEQALTRIPEVEVYLQTTSEPVEAILERSRAHDLVLMGATGQSTKARGSLGPVADRVLQDSSVGVIVVKTRRRMAVPPEEEAEYTAISIVVDRWFAENTYAADEFTDLDGLLRLKRDQGITISLALPALNEEETIGKVIGTIKPALMDRVPLLDEIVLVDSNSSDRTRQVAAGMGIPVHIHQELLPRLGPREGKGEALWKSLLVTHGDMIAWIDTDIVNIHPRFVYGILGPLLLRPGLQMVKGFYHRPLRVGDRMEAGGGGRTTELTARPLLNLFYPELSGVIQPLSGEYAARRQVLESLPFCSGYGVETGLLIDTLERYGLSSIAQVDLLERIHHNQPLEALSKMSFAIIQAVIRRVEQRYGVSVLDEINKSMKLIRYQSGAYFLEVEELVERERPPMVEIEEYRRAHPAAAGGEAEGSSPASVRR